MTRSEEQHVQKMLDTYKQYILSDSWRRRNDLGKYLARLEKEWAEYKKYRKGESHGTCKNETRRPCTV